MGSPLRALVRLLLYVGLTLSLIPAQAVALIARSRARVRIPLFYHRTCCRIFGMTVEVRGEQATRRPILFASNHSSYLDIMVLASLIECSFVAKQEVANWPFFGLLARMQRTVFVVRERRQAAAQRDEITQRLADGDKLILFPEGTSNDGNRVLPFKSALFAVAREEVDGKPLTVQPVSIAYVALDGTPLGRFLRPFYAWYGDMDLAPHLWRVAALGNATVVVEFHPPAPHDAFASRKVLAEYCFTQVAAGVARALAGRGAPAALEDSALEAAQ
ncbi:MAG: lysophospholipid acyltransferase family protein [Alphaproteobacteria bacterium]